jgi:hypothetical protein
MAVLGIHATGAGVAEQILASGFKPGNGLANYLGEGAYFYLVHGDGGYQNAIECATNVARRRYDKVAIVAASIEVDDALNLQNPAVRPPFAAFGANLDRRLAELGVQVEPNDNASYYRPVSHLTIEAFRRCVEAFTGRSFDVLSARFALKSRDIDIELPHEICVKRARAILSVARCDSTIASILSTSDPASWPCTQSIVQAAQQAVRIIRIMDQRDLVDLIVSIYQGSDGGWATPRPRFAGVGPVHLLYDSRRQCGGPVIVDSIVSVARDYRTLQLVDLAKIACAGTPRGQALLGKIIEKTEGVLALHGPSDTEIISLLVTIAERRPEVPILALMAPNENGEPPTEVKAPVMLRSRHNLCYAAMPRLETLSELAKGFLHDRWTDGLAVHDIESKMAARHGTPKTRHRDARRIVEAYYARQHNLL